jgi:hypothetical protein
MNTPPPAHPLPPLELVRSLLHYNPLNGSITYLQHRGPHKPGDPAGGTQGGIPHVFINGRQHKAAAIAWLLTHGVDPSPQHVWCIDRNPNNLILTNLALSNDRPSYRSPRGKAPRQPAWYRRDIVFDRITRMWIAKIGKELLGQFWTRKEAIAARRVAVQDEDDA